jgi:hypothetical protein
MSILALQKQRNPEAGFATDFLDVLERLTPYLHQQPNLKIVTNAGGMNPRACAARAKVILQKAGLGERKIGVVTGDDLLPTLSSLFPLAPLGRGVGGEGSILRNLDTGAPLDEIRPRIVSANAYLGARPIVEALQQGASIVITGRVADASLTLAPAVREFGWPWDDWDRLAAATVAGHLIECGAQCTGGLWCNWHEAPDLANVGYPIVEMEPSGLFRLTKPDGAGGAVNVETASEQLLYEVGDPARYLTPDVVADFTTAHFKQLAQDVVQVRDCRGAPATDSYKVSIAYRDGFMASGTLAIFGPDAPAKARACGAMLLDRVRRAGFDLERTHVETLGSGSVVPGVLPVPQGQTEVMLRVAGHDRRKEAVERFAKEFAPLVTSGPPGTTGYTTGRPQVREVFAYWPALIAKSAVSPTVEVF